MRRSPVRFAGTRGAQLEVDQLVNAVNTLDQPIRIVVTDALKVWFPEVVWGITDSGYLTAQVNEGHRR